MKIENVPLGIRSSNSPMSKFIDAVISLEVGQSFFMEKKTAYLRTAVVILNHVYKDRRIQFVAEGNGWRVGRIV